MTEHLENLDITRECTISRSRIYDVLRWLVAINPYIDIINNNVQLNDGDVFRCITEIEPQPSNAGETSAYMPIGEVSRIVRASWHQAMLESSLLLWY